MFTGTGGFGVEDMPSAHSQTMPKKCVTCHMHRQKAENDDKSDLTLKKGGHTFRPDNQVCLECHKDPKALVAKWRVGMSPLIKQLKTLLDSAPNKKSRRYRRIRLNYDIVTTDGGIGIHNPRYAQILLRHSISSLIEESGRQDIQRSGNQ
jgi:formate-dependent nitrite reductase cytochrome c552 subunit